MQGQVRLLLPDRKGWFYTMYIICILKQLSALSSGLSNGLEDAYNEILYKILFNVLHLHCNLPFSTELWAWICARALAMPASV